MIAPYDVISLHSFYMCCYVAASKIQNISYIFFSFNRGDWTQSIFQGQQMILSLAGTALMQQW